MPIEYKLLDTSPTSVVNWLNKGLLLTDVVITEQFTSTVNNQKYFICSYLIYDKSIIFDEYFSDFSFYCRDSKNRNKIIYFLGSKYWMHDWNKSDKRGSKFRKYIKKRGFFDVVPQPPLSIQTFSGYANSLEDFIARVAENGISESMNETQVNLVQFALKYPSDLYMKILLPNLDFRSALHFVVPYDKLKNV